MIDWCSAACPDEVQAARFFPRPMWNLSGQRGHAHGAPAAGGERYHDDLKTKVAADSAGGTVTITVTERDGRERVSGLGFIR